MTTVSEIVGNPSDPVRAREIDPKWLRHYRTLLALRRRLSDDRAEEMAEVVNPLEGHGMSLADTASDEFDHDLLLAELSADQDRLFEVDEAIRRIEIHTFGICELTGRDIPEERLRAIPWTRFTKEAEEELERQNAVGASHLGQLGSVRAPGVTTPVSAETVLEQDEPSADGLERLSDRLQPEMPFASEGDESATNDEATKIRSPEEP